MSFIISFGILYVVFAFIIVVKEKFFYKEEDMPIGNLWYHLKHKGSFRGTYERDKKKERVFVLVYTKTGRRITFESWQAAQQLGWYK